MFSPWLRTWRWPVDPDGRFPAAVMDQKLLTVNPVIAYRQGPLSVGLGLAVTGAWLEHERSMLASGQDVELQYTALGGGVGFSAGILVTATPWSWLGLSYRSRSVVVLAGRARFEPGVTSCSADVAPCPVSQLALADFGMPDIVKAGFLFVPAPGTRISADALITLWSGIPPGGFMFTAPGPVRVTSEPALNNTFGVRVGFEQIAAFIAPDVKLRGGLFYDRSPVEHGQARPDLPWGDRFGQAFGVGWRLFGIALNAAYVGDLTAPAAGSVSGESGAFVTTTHRLVVSAGYRYLP
jgi:long-subunit fatty acid transport protein